jgi:hypothetical protein
VQLDSLLPLHLSISLLFINHYWRCYLLDCVYHLLANILLYLVLLDTHRLFSSSMVANTFEPFMILFYPLTPTINAPSLNYSPFQLPSSIIPCQHFFLLDCISSLLILMLFFILLNIPAPIFPNSVTYIPLNLFLYLYGFTT